MENVIAVEITLEDGAQRYFLTWGRIQETVNGSAESDLVLRASQGFDLGGTPTRARVCDKLRDAADSPSAPYFYEGLLTFAKPIPFGPSYQAWRAERAAAMEAGQEIYYCGRPT